MKKVSTTIYQITQNITIEKSGRHGEWGQGTAGRGQWNFENEQGNINISGQEKYFSKDGTFFNVNCRIYIMDEGTIEIMSFSMIEAARQTMMYSLRAHRRRAWQSRTDYKKHY